MFASPLPALAATLVLLAAGGCKLDDSLPAFDAASSAIDGPGGADAPVFDGAIPDAVGIPTDALLHYRFDMDLLDASGNDNHGTAALGAFEFATDRFGIGERAGDFTENFGNDDDATVIGPHLGFTINFTIAAWFNGRSFGSEARLVGQGNGFEDPFFSLHIRSADRIGFGRRDIGTDFGPIAVDPELFEQDQWTFFVGVVEFDGADSAIRLYRDGQQVAEEIAVGVAFNNPGTCFFYVGGFNKNDDCTGDRANRLHGLVDDVRVFDRALGEAEILALYHEGGFGL